MFSDNKDPKEKDIPEEEAQMIEDDHTNFINII